MPAGRTYLGAPCCGPLQNGLLVGSAHVTCTALDMRKFRQPVGQLAVLHVEFHFCTYLSCMTLTGLRSITLKKKKKKRRRRICDLFITWFTHYLSFLDFLQSEFSHV
jgi:hypothetical protein